MINFKLINSETLIKCVRAKPSVDLKLTSFSDGCYLEDGNKLYLKYSISEWKEKEN